MTQQAYHLQQCNLRNCSPLQYTLSAADYANAALDNHTNKFWRKS